MVDGDGVWGGAGNAKDRGASGHGLVAIKL